MTVDIVPFKHQRASLSLIRNRKDIPYVFLIGGYGCLTGESKISTPSGPVPLYKFEGGLVNTPIGPRNASWPIPSPSHIVQVEGDGFQIRCNGDHRLQCSELLSRKLDNPQWVDVHSLQALNLSLLFLGPTKQDNDLPIQPLDVLHWKKTIEDCLYGYLAYYHFDDELLHLLVTGDPDKIPLQECVQACNNLFPSENGDDETVLVCTRLWWQMNLLYMRHSKNPSDLLSFVSEYHKSEDCLRLREHFYQVTAQSPCLKDFVLPTLQELESTYETMASATSSVAKIIAEDGNQIHLRKITYSGRDTIYRLHVDEANCYYADGILHHNCGKSFTDVQLLCTITAAYINSPVPLTFGIIGVTIKLLGQTVLKDFKGFLDSANIPYSDNMMKGQLKVGSITFIYLAMSNPGDIYAHNFCGALVDEMDELPAEKVLEVVKAVQERCRVHMPPPFDRDPFIFFSTTAQGLGGTYQLCEYFKKKGLPYAIVKGKTEYNTSLAKTQIELLRKLYTEEEAKAYLDGEFVNLTTGRVYPEFDRKKHVCMRFPIQPTETIYVGQDFNMGYNASSECIVREGHIFIVNSHHWDYMGDAPRRLREMYPTNPIVMIPDASGKEIMSGFSDEMSEAHIQLHWNGKNASITERIMAVNKALSWGQLSVMEPTSDKDSLQDRVIMGLETRDFDDTGKPRKGKGPDALDHGADSTEYATFHIIQSIQGFDKILDVLRATFHRSN